MILAKIIFFISIVAWFFPLFKQYKHNYFYYFLILALTDPISYLLVKLFRFDVERSLLIAALLMVFSFISFYKKHFASYSLIIFISGLVTFTYIPINDYISKFLILVFLLVIVYLVLKAMIVDAMKEKSMSLFYLVLFVYVLSLTLKFYIELTLVMDSFIYFYITTGFEILAAIFFSLYNEENCKRIKLES